VGISTLRILGSIVFGPLLEKEAMEGAGFVFKTVVPGRIRAIGFGVEWT